MIFVILGTHELHFTRLLKELEDLKKEGKIQEEVIVQNGNTRFSSDYLQLIPFMSMEDMETYIKNSSFVISHAGTGSITTSLKLGKKVIIVPRLQKFNEHNDDHQLELSETFSRNGYVLPCYEEDRLENVIEQLKTFTPQVFTADNTQMLNILENFIEGEKLDAY